MAYHLERNPTGEAVDIVVNGFEGGIADSPYAGIADMRGVNITTIPGEAMCNFSTAALTVPPTVSAAAFTAATGTNLFTWTPGGTLYKGVAIQFNSLSNGSAGVSTGVVYYVTNISGSTFQVSNSIGNASTGSPVTITGNISGTFSTYTMGTPLQSCNDYTTSPSNPNIYFVDSNNAAWWIVGSGGNFAAGSLIFLGNITAIGSWAGNGIIVYRGYLFVFRNNTGGIIDYANIQTLLATTAPASVWAYSWKTFVGATGFFDMRPIVGQDDTVYWCNGSFIGSFLQNAGTTFNPATSSTYTYNAQALPILSSDTATCIGELGQNLLVGGIKHFIYPWDRVSIGYAAPLVLPENFTARIVTANNNAYIFAGNRGRIYITNGSGIDEFKKIPDYVSGTIQPYYLWGDATYWHNQLVFTLGGSFFNQSQGYKNDGTTVLTTMNAVWEIDVTSGALRCTMPLSFGTYSGYSPMLAPNTHDLNPVGEGLYIGWNNGSPGIDSSVGAPYNAGQTIIDSDMIPVGLAFSPYTPLQVEWKTTYPIGANGTIEAVALLWRTDLSQSFTLSGTTTSTTGVLSDVYPAGFEKAQWVQLRAIITSNSTTPTYVRLKEFRIRATGQEQAYIAAVQNAALG